MKSRFAQENPSSHADSDQSDGEQNAQQIPIPSNISIKKRPLISKDKKIFDSADYYMKGDENGTNTTSDEMENSQDEIQNAVNQHKTKINSNFCTSKRSDGSENSSGSSNHNLSEDEAEEQRHTQQQEDNSTPSWQKELEMMRIQQEEQERIRQEQEEIQKRKEEERKQRQRIFEQEQREKKKREQEEQQKLKKEQEEKKKVAIQKTTTQENFVGEGSGHNGKEDETDLTYQQSQMMSKNNVPKKSLVPKQKKVFDSADYYMKDEHKEEESETSVLDNDDDSKKVFEQKSSYSKSAFKNTGSNELITQEPQSEQDQEEKIYKAEEKAMSTQNSQQTKKINSTTSPTTSQIPSQPTMIVNNIHSLKGSRFARCPHGTVLDSENEESQVEKVSSKISEKEAEKTIQQQFQMIEQKSSKFAKRYPLIHKDKKKVEFDSADYFLEEQKNKKQVTESMPELHFDDDPSVEGDSIHYLQINIQRNRKSRLSTLADPKKIKSMPELAQYFDHHDEPNDSKPTSFNVSGQDVIDENQEEYYNEKFSSTLEQKKDVSQLSPSSSSSSSLSDEENKSSQQSPVILNNNNQWERDVKLPSSAAKSGNSKFSSYQKQESLETNTTDHEQEHNFQEMSVSKAQQITQQQSDYLMSHQASIISQEKKEDQYDIPIPIPKKKKNLIHKEKKSEFDSADYFMKEK